MNSYWVVCKHLSVIIHTLFKWFNQLSSKGIHYFSEGRYIRNNSKKNYPHSCYLLSLLMIIYNYLVVCNQLI